MPGATRRGVAALLLILLMAGCESNREQDERQVRRQFHVPDEVRLDTLRGSPETGGWFGREGLRIRAVFQFSEAQFAAYLRSLHDPKVWEPVSFLHYSPDGAEEVSADALRWRRLPLPEFPRPLAHLRGLFDTSITEGWYYCSLVLYLRGDSIVHPGGGYHFEWSTIGRHGTESTDDTHPVITTFGILDTKRRRLYAWIGFSG
ncbi:MAG: hypothetical protein M5R41_06230 [Bacteroidia bacterium]|nr:hypothetical protein [Bacteroidia bacterium]